jgi:hypothetical protein
VTGGAWSFVLIGCNSGNGNDKHVDENDDDDNDNRNVVIDGNAAACRDGTEYNEGHHNTSTRMSSFCQQNCILLFLLWDGPRHRSHRQNFAQRLIQTSICRDQKSCLGTL